MGYLIGFILYTALAVLNYYLYKSQPDNKYRGFSLWVSGWCAAFAARNFILLIGVLP